MNDAAWRNVWLNNLQLPVPGESAKTIDAAVEAAGSSADSSVKKPEVAVVTDSEYGIHFASLLSKKGINLTAFALSSRIPDLDCVAVRRFTSFWELQGEMEASAPDYFVAAAFSGKFPHELVAAHQGKILRVHPGKLPEYAGIPDPVGAMMMKGRREGYVSVHTLAVPPSQVEVLGEKLFRLEYFKVNVASIGYNLTLAFAAGAELCADVVRNLHPRSGEAKA